MNEYFTVSNAMGRRQRIETTCVLYVCVFSSSRYSCTSPDVTFYYVQLKYTLLHNYLYAVMAINCVKLEDSEKSGYVKVKESYFRNG